MSKEITREEIKEKILDTPLGEFKGKDFELALDYYLDGREDMEVETLYKKVIKESALDFFKELKTLNTEYDFEQEVSTLVSFLSLSPLNKEKILIESPILKTIRAIPNIENIFIIYTKDSEKRFKELKKYLKTMNKYVVGKSVDIENVNDSYNYLHSLVKAGEIDRTNTIMDSTLGLRMFGIALYKIAVERGINLIAWRDYQLPSYIKKGEIYLESEKTNKRIPFLTKLILMQEPKFENAKLHRALIEELKNFNFSGASNYYDTLGIKDLKILCQDLDEIFNLKYIFELDPEDFYQNLENIIKKILDYDLEEEKNKESIKLILLKLLPLVNYKKLLKGINNFNIKVNEVDSYIENLLKIDKNIKVKIYYLFVLKYLNIKLEEKAINSTIIKNIIKKISKYNKKELEINTIDEILDELFDNYNIKHLTTFHLENLNKLQLNEREKKIEIKRKLTDIFELADNLVDDVEYPIEWNKSILKIAKYNLNIDFFAEEKARGVNYIFTQKSTIEKMKYNSIAIPIIKLFVNNTEEFDDWKIEGIYNEKKIQGINTLSKNKSNLRNIIKFINDIINLKLKELGKEGKDFIIVEDKVANKSKKSLKKIYINNIFQEIGRE